MIKAILFDLDGTLLNSNEAVYKAYMSVFDNMKIPPLTFQEFKKVYTVDFEEFERKIGITVNIRSMWLNAYDRFKYLTTPFPGVEDFLRKIRKDGYKIALITSGTRDRVKEDLERHGLSHFFDVVLTNEDVLRVKPNPIGLKIAIEKLGLPVNECIYVGDMGGDVLAAKNCGIKVLGVTWGLHDFGMLEKFNPDVIVNDFNELYQVIRNFR